MASLLAKQLAKVLGSPIVGSRPMRGGDIADVSCLTLGDGRMVVAKRPRADQPDTTSIEATMLQHLSNASSLPVPDVLFQAPGILVISHLKNTGETNSAQAAKNVAHHVAALHRVAATSEKPFGFQIDTVIGPLPQINKPHQSWVSFFAENRLLAMARSCMNTSRLDAIMYDRLEKLAANLGDIIPDTPLASLLHGDLWAGNILIDANHVAGFIDPAISYGHHEMDLAFIKLMGGLDPIFFDAYNAEFAIEPGFQEKRCALYQLWPLLVHVRLFGGRYIDSVSNNLKYLGF